MWLYINIYSRSRNTITQTILKNLFGPQNASVPLTRPVSPTVLLPVERLLSQWSPGTAPARFCNSETRFITLLMGAALSINQAIMHTLRAGNQNMYWIWVVYCHIGRDLGKLRDEIKVKSPTSNIHHSSLKFIRELQHASAVV